MLFKKSLSVAIIIYLSLSVFTRCFAEEPSAATSLGLSVATAITDEKNVAKGLTKVAKDQTSEWLWTMLGGMENIVNNTDEAQIPVIKDKLFEIVGIVQSIEKISFAIGEGKYDTAAIEAMDQIVGKVNHPLVTLTWSAVKMTYESHLALQSAKAAVQIEVLYNVVNKDRRMMGTIDPGSDSPPTIAMDKDATEYFFNKYVMTNDSVRQALKAYVTTVLGEDWPEQSWSEWLGSFRTIGTGLDTAKDAELAMLDKEWRDRGNSWVRRAMIDVNKQAKLAWSQVRLRQAAAKFKAFSDRVGHFYNGDFESMLKDYMDIQKYKKEIPIYKAALKKSPIERAKVSKEISKLKSTNLKNAGGLQQTANSWRSKVYSYYSRANAIKKEALANSLLKETQAWQGLRDKVDAFLYSQEGRIEQEIETDIQKEAKGKYITKYWGDNGELVVVDFGPEIAAYRKSFFRDIKNQYKMEEFVWDMNLEKEKPLLDAQGSTIDISTDVELFKKQLLDQCNKGNVSIASEMLRVWGAAAKRYLDEWKQSIGPVLGGLSEIDSWVRERERAKAKIAKEEAALEAIGVARGELSRSLAPCNQETQAQRAACLKNARDTMRAFDRQIPPAKKKFHAAQRVLNLINMGWQEAVIEAKDVAQGMVVVAEHIYNKNMREVSIIPEVFGKLAKVRAQQYGAYKNVLSAVLKIGLADELLNSLKKDVQSAGEREYMYFTPIKSDNPYVMGLPGLIRWKATETARGMDVSFIMQSLNQYEAKFSAWKSAIELWKKTEKLSSQDIMQIQMLVKPGRDLRKDIELAEKIVSSTPSAINQIRNYYRQMIQIAERDGDNRAKDSYWLLENSRALQRFINELIGKGWMRKGNRDELEVVLPAEPVDGMLPVVKPYKHYMTQKELDDFKRPIVAFVESSKAAQFMKKNAPDHYRKLTDIIKLQEIKAAAGKNFIVANQVVYADDIKKAEKLVNSLSLKSKNLDDTMAKIAKLLPLTLNVMTDKELAYYKSQARIYNLSLEEYYKKILGKTPSKTDYSFRFIDLTGDFLDTHELGKKYLALRQKVKDFFDEQRAEKIIAGQTAVAQGRLIQFKKEFDALKSKVNKAVNSSHDPQSAIQELYQQYWDLRTRYSKDKKAQEPGFSKELESYDIQFTNISKQFEATDEKSIQEIKTLYEDFKSAYEQMNESLLVNFLSENWDSGDGTSLTDLEDNFHNMFSVYDEISYSISNLSVMKKSAHIFVASYDVTISGQIYAMSVTREEKSSVSEEVLYENGHFKINRTLNGRFWYRK